MKDLALRELIVDMAYEIIAMHEEAQLKEVYKAEAKEWRDKHSKLVRDDIKNGEIAMGNWLNLLLTCDVTPRKEIADGAQT